ncbi:MAG: beta-ketoacyl synthase [Thermoanaerobaculia bacterium]|nr:beta-ketoacyl synthase [Thermoanaerobaculia bacterium]
MVKAKRRVGIFGWGLVAPRSPNIETFEENLSAEQTWLAPFDGYGPSNFLVGTPEFDFEAYKPWIDSRFEPRKFPQLSSKMGPNVKYAIGAFIQALGQNPGMEELLSELGPLAHVYVGTGLGDLSVAYDASIAQYEAQRRWTAFWCQPDQNPELASYRSLPPGERPSHRASIGAPEDPQDLETESEGFDQARSAWLSFWLTRSVGLRDYLAELGGIESESIGEDVETSKGHVIRRKMMARKRLNQKYGCPLEPWASVDAKLLWNIANIPAAQISMLGGITGPAMAPTAACSTFGVALKCALNAIELGQAKVVVVGATDPPPHPLSVSSFYSARVLAHDGAVSKPLTGMRGTHVSGGACIWIVGDAEYLRQRGMNALGLEILGVGLSSDADHIITPSEEGPRAAIRLALDNAGIEANRVAAWDMHATATPGDWTELLTALSVLPDARAITARKGSFGHGMAVCGGWELTAQHLGVARGTLHPVHISPDEIHPIIQPHLNRLVKNEPMDVEGDVAGKINMGIGGINSCVVCRRWEEAESADPRPAGD